MKLGLFVGSFDPFHIGHYEIVKICLEYNYVDKIAILANNPNNSKPNRLILSHRIAMIKHYFQNSNKNVIVVEEDCDTYINNINNLDKQTIKIGIVGSDQTHKKPKLLTDEWIIIPRSNYVPDKIDWGCEITYISAELFKNQNWSSTMIRNELLSNTQLLNKNVLEYIQVNNLYNVNQIIIKLLDLKNISIQFIKYNIFKIIDIESSNPLYVIKLFYDHQDYINELQGYQILEKYNFHIPNIKGINLNNYYIVRMEYIGPTIEEMVKITDKYYDIGLAVGKELKKLHQINNNKSNINKKELMNNRKIKNLMESNKINKPLFDKFVDNLGSEGLTHGDASLSNLTIDHNFKIGFIDSGKVDIDGIPVYEYYQFISSIKWKIQDEYIRNELTNGFINGYGLIEFTSETIEICKLYWNLQI